MDDLRKLLAAATPGPWIVGSDEALRDGVWSESAITMADSGDGRPSHLVAWCHSDWRAGEDAALIVAAVNALPALLDVVEAAKDLYSIAVGEHGHDETHSADWPSCLPAHMAMHRYRACLARLEDPR